MLKILIIDDHDLFREGMRFLLERLDNDIELLHAKHCEQAFNVIAEQTQLELTLDLILLDLSLPGITGLQGLQQLQKQLRTVPIIVLSATRNHEKIQQVFDHGAQGFIPKSFSSEIMLTAINIVLAGGIYIPYDLLNSIKKELGNRTIDALSQRQQQVLTLLADGHSNKIIARKLNISDNTVRVHVAAILKTLGVKNRTEAAKQMIDIAWT